MKKSISIIAILFISLVPKPIFAQADPGEDPDALAAPMPIDVGISLQLVAGIFYGLKKINGRRSK